MIAWTSHRRKQVKVALHIQKVHWNTNRWQILQKARPLSLHHHQWQPFLLKRRNDWILQLLFNPSFPIQLLTSWMTDKFLHTTRVWRCKFTTPACRHHCMYSVSINSCIEKLSSYVNKQANVYTLSCLLPTTTWGVYQPFKDHSRKLCNPITNEPITIWIIGHIASTWFTCGNMPEKQVLVTIIPLSDALAMQSTRLIARLTVPPAGIDIVFHLQVWNLTTHNYFRSSQFRC